MILAYNNNIDIKIMVNNKCECASIRRINNIDNTNNMRVNMTLQYACKKSWRGRVASFQIVNIYVFATPKNVSGYGGANNRRKVVQKVQNKFPKAIFQKSRRLCVMIHVLAFTAQPKKRHEHIIIPASKLYWIFYKYRTSKIHLTNSPRLVYIRHWLECSGSQYYIILTTRGNVVQNKIN